ncbi:hypothetical protein QVO10_16220 [Bacteroides gallinaceum]|uniref:Glycosyltransferase n=1 Tax=Bacteroides gallinaceum TaxID=1462571 RepID=A0ABT7XAL7_9BACE|nr:hypothetical protein [Bacteroides gallinaceum]MDN0050898.1 hypothetical protein [Bacteroides gallinaceum]
MNIGICVIAFNRIESLKRVLNSLSRAYYNEDVSLIISIDKSDSTEVGKYADNFDWKFGIKKIIKHPINLGLRKHVLKCGDLLEDFDALVVLEDDVSVAPSFYFYAKQCVEKYYNDDNVAGISLYNFPFNYHTQMPFYPMPADSDIYLMQCAQSWGEIWMRPAWKSFKLWYDNHNEEFGDMPHLPHSICHWPKSSWLKYHTKYCIEQNKYFIYPYISLSTNNSDIGTHSKSNNSLPQSIMLYGKKEIFKLTPQVKYDAFFESEMIADLLGIKKTDLCIDVYGEKKNREKKRYWLTMSCQPYKIVSSYGLCQKTYEWNIINNIKGDDIFLYDTNIQSPKPKRNIHERLNLLKYFYKIQGLRNVFMKKLI